MAACISSFKPIACDFNLRDLVDKYEHIVQVDILSKEEAHDEGFDKLIQRVIRDGKPVLVDGYRGQLDEQVFSAAWLHANHGRDCATAWDLNERVNVHTTIGGYLDQLDSLTSQFFSAENISTTKRPQRLYLKDLDCPETWLDSLKALLPSSLHYLDGDTAEESTNSARHHMVRRSGDLMSSLPPDMRFHNLMCYIGHEGTYTPIHQTICASVGINIMVEATEFDRNNDKAQEGSSLWFMTRTEDKDVVTRYWQNVLGRDIDQEDHFADLRAWQDAPFTVYVAEQTAGEMLILPPLAPYQVWNRGTRTMKIAWSINNPQTTSLAIRKVLPSMQQSYKPQHCQVKAMVYFSLQEYHVLLQQQAMRDHFDDNWTQVEEDVQLVVHDFVQLFEQFEDMLLEESFHDSEQPPFALLGRYTGVTCGVCYGAIFNRFLSTATGGAGTRQQSPDSLDDLVDICLTCYAGGRTLPCGGELRWIERYAWSRIMSQYNAFRNTILLHDPSSIQTRPSFAERQAAHCGRTLIERCQDRMKKPSTQHIADSSILPADAVLITSSPGNQRYMAEVSIPSSPPSQPEESLVVPNSVPRATEVKQLDITDVQRPRARMSVQKRPRLPDPEGSDDFVDCSSDNDSRSTSSQSPASDDVRAETRHLLRMNALKDQSGSQTVGNGYEYPSARSPSLPCVESQNFTHRARTQHPVVLIPRPFEDEYRPGYLQQANPSPLTTFAVSSATKSAKRKSGLSRFDDTSKPPKRRSGIRPEPVEQAVMPTHVTDASAGRRSAAHQWLDDVFDEMRNSASIITLRASVNRSELTVVTNTYPAGTSRTNGLIGHSSPPSQAMRPERSAPVTAKRAASKPVTPVTSRRVKSKAVASRRVTSVKLKPVTSKSATSKRATTEKLPLQHALQELVAPPARKRSYTSPRTSDTVIDAHSIRQSNNLAGFQPLKRAQFVMPYSPDPRRPLGEIPTNTHRH